MWTASGPLGRKLGAGDRCPLFWERSGSLHSTDKRASHSLLTQPARTCILLVGPGWRVVHAFPSMIDGFFEEISQSGLDPATQLPNINRIAAKYQLEIVGPPLE